MRILRHNDGEAGGGAAAPATAEIDFNKLTEPEGAPEIPSAQPAAEVKVETPSKVEIPAKVEPTVETPAPKVEKTPEQIAADKANLPFYKQFYDKLLSEVDLPKDFKPTELTEDNYLDEIAKVMYDNMDLPMHPKVQRLQELVNAHNGNFEAALKDFSTASTWKQLTDEQLMEWHLKENLKAPEEKVKELLGKMNVELEALKIRKELEIGEQNAINHRTKQLNDLRDDEIRQEREDFNKNLEDTVGKLKDKAEYCGIPADAKQKQEFPEIFKQYVTPGEDGVPLIAKLLTDNDFLSDVVFLAHYKSKAVKDFMDSEKNKIKQVYKDKLDPDPKHTDKSVTHVANEIDFSKLAAPEGTY